MFLEETEAAAFERLGTLAVRPPLDGVSKGGHYGGSLWCSQGDGCLISTGGWYDDGERK